MNRCLAFFTVFIFVTLACNSEQRHPAGETPQAKHVYLTWAKDATHTSITVNYHSPLGHEESLVLYDQKSARGNTKAYELKSSGSSLRVGQTQRRVHRVNLERLIPATTYYFVVKNADGFSAEYKFKTMPQASFPLRMIDIGDMGSTPRTKQLLTLASKLDPPAHFAFIGGDIAYAFTRDSIEVLAEWDKWLSNWQEIMKTPEGHLIPLVLAIGNHETDSCGTVARFLNVESCNPYFFQLFSQDARRTYFKRRFGPDFSFFVLDSDHKYKWGGDQKDWLKEELKQARSIQWKIVGYHIPIYPSGREYNSSHSKKTRKSWLKYFDRYSVNLGLEHHDHRLKRTKMLREGNEVSQGGLVFLGDGAGGGKIIRDSKGTKPRPYLAYSDKKFHFWVIDILADQLKYQAIGLDGTILDSGSQNHAIK